jgi:hypothetical protein
MKPIQFMCPQHGEYVNLRTAEELLPSNTDLDLYCPKCRVVTAVLSIRPKPLVIHQAPVRPWKPEKDQPA